MRVVSVVSFVAASSLSAGSHGDVEDSFPVHLLFSRRAFQLDMDGFLRRSSQTRDLLFYWASLETSKNQNMH